MTIAQFRILQHRLSIQLQKHKDWNPLPSDTDPTQDIPVKSIQLAANGEPINVKRSNGVFNGIPADKLSSVEKRNNDKFDQLGELQNLARQAGQHGITTDLLTKTTQNNEIEKND